MKRFVAVFLIFILIFSFTTPSYATTLIGGLEQVKPTDPLSPSNPFPSRGVDDDFNSDGGENPEVSGLTKRIVDIFNKIFEISVSWLTWIICKMPTVDGSVWAQQNYFQLSFFDSNPSGFAGEIQGVIGSLYNALRYMVAAIYVVILVYLGIRMILSSIGKQKAHYKDLLKYWLTGLLLLFAFHWVMAFAIWTSDTFTKMFADVGVDQVNAVAKSLDATNIVGMKGTPDSVTDAIVAIICKDGGSNLFSLLTYPLRGIYLIALLCFGIFISLTYIKRLFTIALLLVLFPLVVLSYVFDKIGDRRAQTFGIWLKEFMTNVFVQPIHAFLLMIISFLLSLEIVTTPIIGPIIALLLLGLLPVGEKQIKQLFQISSNMGAGSGGLAGAMGTLAHASQVAKNAKALGAKATSSLSEKIAKTKNKIAIRDENKKAMDKANESAKKWLNANKDSGKSKKELKEGMRKARAESWERTKNSAGYKLRMKALGQKPGSLSNDLKSGLVGQKMSNSLKKFHDDVKANGFKDVTKNKIESLGKKLGNKFSIHDAYTKGYNKGGISDKASRIRGGIEVGKHVAGQSLKGAGKLAGKAIKGAGKTAAFAGKVLSIPVGAGFGLAQGIASAKELEDLITNPAAGLLVGTASGMMMSEAFSKTLTKNNKLPDELKEADILLNAKFSNLSPAEKEKLATAVGLSKNETNMLTEDNRDYITKKLETRKMLAKRGLNYKGVYADAFDEDAFGVSDLQSGRDPYTGEKLNVSDYESKQTKDALYMKSKKTGQIFRLKGHGNKNASNSIQEWYNNDMDLDKYTNNAIEKATKMVNDLNGDGIGASNSVFFTQKQYNERLAEEVYSAKQGAKAHVSALENLANSPYNIMSTKQAEYVSAAEANFHTVEAARNGLNANTWTEVCASYTTYADNLTNGTLSTNDITNKVIALEQAKMPFSLETICQNAGCDYNIFKQGGATETQVAQIAQAVQQEYQSAPADIQQTVTANVIDMENKANATIQTMVENGTLSRESINLATSTATGGNFTDITTQSSKLSQFLSTSSIETKNNMIHLSNNQQYAEVTTTPYAPTIVTAQKNGQITTPVNISNIPGNVTQIFGTCQNTAVQTEVFRDPSTGNSKMKISSVESPSKFVIVDTDMESSSNSTTVYAGDLSIGANGEITLQRSEDEVAVYNTTQEQPKETFGDITLDDIRSWTGTSSTNFTLVRNEDICVILDSNNKVIAIRQGLESIGQLKQPKIFYVEANGNELEVTGPTSTTHDTIIRAHCNTYGRSIQQSNPEEYSLLNRLFRK